MSFEDVKREGLQELHSLLLDQYRAAQKQYALTLDAAHKVTLDAQMRSLEQNIKNVEAQLAGPSVTADQLQKMFSDAYSAELRGDLQYALDKYSDLYAEAERAGNLAMKNTVARQIGSLQDELGSVYVRRGRVVPELVLTPNEAKPPAPSRAGVPVYKLAGIIGMLILISIILIALGVPQRAVQTLRSIFDPAPVPEPLMYLDEFTVPPPAGTIALNPIDGAEYVYIPAGEFIVGSSDEDQLTQDDERPQHTVYLDAFWMKRTEVTNSEYAKCVDAGACTEPYNDFWTSKEKAYHPVTNVAWSQANDYSEWVGGTLPTEEQWEKACRGTDGRIYPWGNELPDDTRLNYRFAVGDTTAVGSYPAGANSLYDMSGNALEWTLDPFDIIDHYNDIPSANPPGPESREARTLRGGSFGPYTSDHNMRCDHRFFANPNIPVFYVGFRVLFSGTVDR